MAEALTPYASNQEPESSDATYDDRPNYERIAAWWDKRSRMQRSALAGAMALVATTGLVGGRFLLDADQETAANSPRAPGAAAGLQPDTEAVAPGLPAPSETNDWAWKAACTDMAVSRIGGTVFTITPTILRQAGVANPSGLYTVATFDTSRQYESEVVAVPGIGPITVNLAGFYGTLQVAAVYFPTDQPPGAEGIPPKMATVYPDVIVAACEPLYPIPDESPTRIDDLFGNRVDTEQDL